MYQHPVALDFNASYYRQEALRAAEQHRRLRQEPSSEGVARTFGMRRRLVAIGVVIVAVATLVILP